MKTFLPSEPSPSVHSSVLVVAPSVDKSQLTVGADFATTYDQALETLEAKTPEVIVVAVDTKSPAEVINFIQHLRDLPDEPATILINNNCDNSLLRQLINLAQVFQIIPREHIETLQPAIEKALEQRAQRKQAQSLIQLFHSQNQKLRSQTQTLEDHIKVREQKIARSHKRLLQANARLTGLHQVLVAIHQATSIAQMEILIRDSLSSHLDLEWIRILFTGQEGLVDQMKSQFGLAFFSAPLYVDQKPLGTLAFLNSAQKPIKKDDQELLREIADTVGFAIDRLTKIEEAGSLKQQWEATFDSIQDALCLTNSQFNILRSNEAFMKLASSSYRDLIGQNCFQVVLNHLQVMDSSLLQEEDFQMELQRENKGPSQVFLVRGQKIQLGDEEDSIFLIFFRDITEQKKLEKRILNSSKMAELGTIGSSIAHELNNPLGGMISYLQLMLMDLSEENEIYKDVKEMEAAAQKCKEIIENLLGFSRKVDPTDWQQIDLRDVLLQSIKISELQTRSRGIKVETKFPEHKVLIKGQPSLLTQAFRNILQNSVEALLEKSAKSGPIDSKISVSIVEAKDHYILTIEDNGIGIAKENLGRLVNPLYTTKEADLHSGLGLTVAYQFIHQHGGSLEFSSQPLVGTKAVIQFEKATPSL